MRWNLLVSSTILAGTILTDAAFAHPGHSHRKRPSTPNSQVPGSQTLPSATLRGSFVWEKDGQVQLRNDDDSVVILKLSDLPAADQTWVRNRMEEIRQSNGHGTAASQLPLSSSRVPLALPVSSFHGGMHSPIASDSVVVNPAENPWQTPSRFATNESEVPAFEDNLFNEAAQLPILLAQLDEPQGPNEPDNQAAGGKNVPAIATAFAAFVKANAIQTRWDKNYFYVESSGIPAHRMMVGITAWQQQVPLPQNYTGENSWQIPLSPKPAKSPISAKNNFLRGAIAIAVNGVPIFNPLNNRGEDAFLAGELDEFGGHCGRADDYHYHMAPVHLQKLAGKGLPIAYALDGYPIYGFEEPDGSPAKNLDKFNGHTDADGNYHYHATKNYPYLNGGFFGEVIQRDGQVDPQPRAEPLRPAGSPLRGATITEFEEIKPNTFKLTYEVRRRRGSVTYTIAKDGSIHFVFADTAGNTSSETHTPRRLAGEKPGLMNRRKNAPDGRAKGGAPDRDAVDREAEALENLLNPGNQPPGLQVTSASVDAKGKISIHCTCDGDGFSPAVDWGARPDGAKSFAVSIWHTAPDQEKSYWVVYDIPANVTRLPKNVRNIGKPGLNDRKQAIYEPMCSKGPGEKTYHITVYALSIDVGQLPGKLTRAGLLKAIEGKIVATGTLDFVYERPR